jgi:pimeloyl-ACP methyl ester carboxylesterase
VTRALGALDAAHCAGIHVTLAMGTRPLPSDAHRRGTLRCTRIAFYPTGTAGYSQAAGHPPADPGLRADRFTGRPGGVDPGEVLGLDRLRWPPENVLGRDELLDNVMLYWVTASAASSARLYWESFGGGKRRPGRWPCPPAWRCIRRRSCRRCGAGWRQAYTDIRHWQVMPRGGHFAAFEQPGLFVDDVRAFFGTLR